MTNSTPIEPNPTPIEQRPSLKPIPQIMQNPHFEMLGGEEPIKNLVEKFYFYMNTLPEAAGIRSMHEADLTHTKQVLVKFLVEWLGGPKAYSTERGHPRLRQKHLPFSIGEAERDVWMLCMKRAMDDVVPNDTLKQQMEQAFFKTADFIRNDR
ncbi:MAG: group II truncated hemoglobin [Methylophilus sp.]